MKKKKDKQLRATPPCQLMEAKRARQEQDRADIRAGRRTPESMALFSREMASKVKVEIRDVDYNLPEESERAIEEVLAQHILENFEPGKE